LIAVALAVIGATAVGIMGERRVRGARTLAQRMLTLMPYVLVPFVSFVSIAQLRVTVAGGVGLVFAFVAMAVAGVVAWAAGRHVLRLSDSRLGAVICAVVVANTGSLGYPMTVALLQAGALPSAVAYDQIVNGPALFLVAFGVGAAFGSVATTARARYRSFLTRNPPLLAVVAGLVAPASLAPAPLPAISRVLVVAMLLAGFYAVGVYLSSERREDQAPLLERPDRPVLLALGLRLLSAPAILLGLSVVFVRVPNAYLLESAMPTGINSLIVGHSYGLDQQLIATIIVWSTVTMLVGGLVGAVV
jgi:predicted permease